jgi:Malate/L-lactate dehydrogenase
MTVWGGSELLLGTNPLGIGVPSDMGPVVLDMATTVVSYGTVKKYALADHDLPEDPTQARRQSSSDDGYSDRPPDARRRVPSASPKPRSLFGSSRRA